MKEVNVYLHTPLLKGLSLSVAFLHMFLHVLQFSDVLLMMTFQVLNVSHHQFHSTTGFNLLHTHYHFRFNNKAIYVVIVETFQIYNMSQK